MHEKLKALTKLEIEGMAYLDFYRLHENIRTVWSRARGSEQTALLPVLNMVFAEMARREAAGSGMAPLDPEYGEQGDEG